MTPAGGRVSASGRKGNDNGLQIAPAPSSIAAATLTLMDVTPLKVQTCCFFLNVTISESFLAGHF
jgi:hypothetical protein